MFKSILVLALVFTLSGCQTEEEKAAIQESQDYIKESYSKYVQSITFKDLAAYTQVSYLDGKLMNKAIYVCGQFTDEKGQIRPFVFSNSILWQGIKGSGEGVFIDKYEGKYPPFIKYQKNSCRNSQSQIKVVDCKPGQENEPAKPGVEYMCQALLNDEKNKH
ncbi:hypothetical protein C9426_13615 [Serratia sp. S1B]|nr:hypothetical protein C9426_13615 [Serratia sp. S1B]